MASSAKFAVGDERSWLDDEGIWHGVIIKDIEDQQIQIQLRHPDLDGGQSGSAFWVDSNDQFTESVKSICKKPSKDD